MKNLLLNNNSLISNLRLGFATNSSSTHSIIIASKEDKQKIMKKGHNCSSLGGYKWELFVLTTPREKYHYITCLMSYTFMDVFQLNKEQTLSLLDRLFPLSIFKPCIRNSDYELKCDTTYDEGYIDHQSIEYMPLPNGIELKALIRNEDIIYESYKELAGWIYDVIVVNDNVLILGGSDNGNDFSAELNDGNSIYTPFSGIVINNDYKYAMSDTVFSYDKENDFITLFSRRDGTRIRTVKKNLKKPEYRFSPELVDLKITNKCNIGCPDCYQSSIPDGTHANYVDIYNVLKNMADNHVLEVAIGGGDPLQHNKIETILNYSRSIGLIPNISTADFDFFLNENNTKKISSIVKSCGAIGLSIPPHLEFSDIEAKLLQVINKITNFCGKCTIHLVIGRHNVEFIDKLFNLIQSNELGYVPVVLLKYQQAGFADGIKPKYDISLFDVLYLIKSRSYISISLGSSYVTEFEELIKKYDYKTARAIETSNPDQSYIMHFYYRINDIKNVLYEQADGRFSMYLDLTHRDKIIYGHNSFNPFYEMERGQKKIDISELFKQVRI